MKKRKVNTKISQNVGHKPDSLVMDFDLSLIQQNLRLSLTNRIKQASQAANALNTLRQVVSQ